MFFSINKLWAWDLQLRPFAFSNCSLHPSCLSFAYYFPRSIASERRGTVNRQIIKNSTFELLFYINTFLFLAVSVQLRIKFPPTRCHVPFESRQFWNPNPLYPHHSPNLSLQTPVQHHFRDVRFSCNSVYLLVMRIHPGTCSNRSPRCWSTIGRTVFPRYIHWYRIHTVCQWIRLDICTYLA